MRSGVLGGVGDLTDVLRSGAAEGRAPGDEQAAAAAGA